MFQNMATIHKKIIFLSLLFIIISVGCKKTKENEDYIPNVLVNFYIDINSTQYNGINSVGGFVYVNGGVRGIIIYRKSYNEFIAYERNCPYQPLNTCARVSVDPSYMTVTDTCCGSKFLLLDGSVVKGPATTNLKMYKTYLDGSLLYISN